MSYNPRSGNPFAQNDANKEWTNNNLILQDPKLRERSGVSVLDSDVADLYAGPQEGGAVGAPFHIKKHGSPGAKPYPQSSVHPMDPEQVAGAPLPRHYYENNKRW